MKKLIAPVIYIGFLIPILAITMSAIEVTARKYDFIPDYIIAFQYPYILIIIFVVLTFGIPIYWLANRLIQIVDKIKSPSFQNHFRQSLFYYILITLILMSWMFRGFEGGEDDVYFLSFLIISLLAITSNYFQILHKCREGKQED